QLPVIAAVEVAKHNKKTDCWVVLHGGVYNVTDFLSEHPGGPGVILSAAGKDVTDHYEEIGHSDFARRIAAEHKIGILEGCPLYPHLSRGKHVKYFNGPWMLAAIAVAAAYLAFFQ
ncbi:hypothetical protein FOZ62_014146, partial [Perkinsus olseni]